MPWNLKANIRGPQGFVGPDGAQGLPGVNAIANDAAVAGYLLTTGSSATKDAVSISSAPAQQAKCYGTFLSKLNSGVATTIVFRGDSIVYGQDTVSADKVAPPATVLPDGTTHAATRSPSPFPDVLQGRLWQVFGSNVTVLNQGYSGDYVKRSYERWTANVGADLTAYMFGINDATMDYVPAPYKGSIPLYLEWLERMLLRDLAWGSAVVFMTPSKLRDRTAPGSLLLDKFRTALYALAARYSVPVIDTEPLLGNYGGTHYSDGVHLNSTGYTAFASRLAACFIGEGPHRPFRVGGDSVLATRPRQDNCVLGPGAAYITLSGGGAPPENTLPMAIHPAANTVDGFAFYSFYVDAPDTYVVPMVYLASDGVASAEWEAILDFGVAQGDYTSDYTVGMTATDTTTRELPNTWGGPRTAFGSDFNFLASGAGVGAAYPGQKPSLVRKIRIVDRGWHSLKIRVKRSTSGGDAALNGLQFVSWRDWHLQTRLDAIGA